jgi:hypothetical protein
MCRLAVAGNKPLHEAEAAEFGPSVATRMSSREFAGHEERRNLPCSGLAAQEQQEAGNHRVK